MPTPVLSPGTLAIFAQLLGTVAAAIGITILPDQAAQIVAWGASTWAVVATAIAIYHHWTEKATVVTLSNQITAAGSVPKAGPSQGMAATPARMAAAKSNPTGGVS